MGFYHNGKGTSQSFINHKNNFKRKKIHKKCTEWFTEITADNQESIPFKSNFSRPPKSPERKKNKKYYS